MKIKSLNLLNDQALGEGTPNYDDGLGFETYASVLASAASATEGPFTIGIFGEWGTGKTSLMRLIKSNLSTDDNVITVWFNAWRYEKEEHPIVPLIGTIVHALEKHKSFRSKLKDGGKSLINALRAIAYGFSTKTKLKLPGFAEIEASFVAKDMIDRSDKLSPDPLIDRSLYYQAFETLEGVKVPRKAKIVVLIDDLDRCFPNLAIKLLESIKLVLSQKGFIFFLGVARKVLEGYLQHRYKNKYGIPDFEGKAYLDKIIQLPFSIPSHHGKMNEFSEVVLKRVEKKIRSQLSDILPTMGEALNGNPRSIIRFLNNILIDLSINENLAEKKIMKKIPVEYFAITRCLEQRWHEILDMLVDNDELSDEVSRWDRETIRREANSSISEISKIATVLNSDKGLQKILLEKPGISWLINKDIRREAIQFLRTQRQDSASKIKEHSIYYDIFLSYSGKNRNFVIEMAGYLADEGIKVFMDTEVKPGDRWDDVLLKAVSNSKAIGFCISEESVKSSYVQQEINYAIYKLAENPHYRIIPILLPNSDLSLLPEQLKKYHVFDLRGGINRDRIQNLVKILKRT